MKRLLDICVSLLGIILLAPVYLAITLWIKFDSAGPLLYRGKRVGRNGEDIAVSKFRTMVVNADKIGGSSTADDDPRITASGKFLRKFKLDELPQLFDVLFGSMSLVGPRPQVRWAVELYSQDEQRLLDVRPGITDFASLAFRNEGEILLGSLDPDADYMQLIAPFKNRLALEYVERRGVFLDLKIILATVLAIGGVNPQWCLSASSKNVVLEFEQNLHDFREARRLAEARRSAA